jgi:hypothetical protein
MVIAKNNDADQELAYFRFALVAPVIQGLFPDASIKAYCRRVTQTPVMRPDGVLFSYKPATLERWVNSYKVGGMEALMPKVRSDKGSTRCLSGDCILEIYNIKEKFPKLNAVQIHLHLVQEGLLPATISSRTIQRFIKAQGLKSVALSGPLKDRKAFEEPHFGAMWMADTCFFPYIPDKDGKRKRTYLICIIDDNSRMIVGARLF